jgi:hypothetical protein
MADQATLTDGPSNRIDSPIVEGIVGNMTEFGGNLLTLAELQGRLALYDAQECAARAVMPVALAVGGAVLAAAGLPVLLIGAASLLAEATGWPEGLALLVCGLVALGLGGVLAFLFGRRIGASFESFRRSRDEFTRNLAWVKTVLLQSGRPAPRGRRY